MKRWTILMREVAVGKKTHTENETMKLRSNVWRGHRLRTLAYRAVRITFKIGVHPAVPVYVHCYSQLKPHNELKCTHLFLSHRAFRTTIRRERSVRFFYVCKRADEQWSSLSVFSFARERMCLFVFLFVWWDEWLYGCCCCYWHEWAPYTEIPFTNLWW